MGSYVPSTLAERQQMLEAIGLKDYRDLYKDVPQDMYLENGLNLPEGMSELEVRRAVSAMAEKNTVFATVLRGAGAYDHVIPSSVNYIPAGGDADEACESYAKQLRDNPPDVVCMGIGENGHIAFNDPPVADFCDPKLVKKVALDDICRMQQVHDGCFPTFDDVPKYALTLTVPALMSAEHLICTVPAPTKADAVCAMLTGEVGEACPATALRRHDSAKMFLDRDSGSKVL